jgi:hypothetical protein
VEELQKKIADLEKTISQLQQTAVAKEDIAEKSDTAVSRKEHHAASVSHKSAQSRARHAAPARWILKAAKPGVAWVAKRGSDDLHMVETGDSLSGVGRITEISQDSLGAWVVRGTRGRISQ